MDANGTVRQIGPSILGSTGLSTLFQGRDGGLYGTSRGDGHAQVGTVFRISGFAPCIDALRLSYSAGTLNLGFTLRTDRPATWKTWLAVPGPPEQSAMIWSAALPAIAPTLSFNVPIPAFPHLGDVFALTVLQTPQGVLCADWKMIDTGK